MYLSIVSIVSEITSLGYLSSIQLLQDDELKKMFNSLLFLMLSILLVGFPILNQITNSTILIAVTVVLNFYYSFAEKTFIRNMEAKNLNVIRIGRVTFNSIVIITSFYLFGGNNSRIIILFNILSIFDC